MSEYIQNEAPYDEVLSLIVEIVAECESSECPSPTLGELSNQIGYSEELILESLEYGNLEPVSILQ
ncbi:hypothetical protein MM300_16625 [Evansella sp. LMS18]|jgi:hypothetical protein|uniref:hypothetical protein n=1 Tax=Evansella sp. LMS18 TaxID=2924033 RepID=UPI0020D12D1A|nr:hypothetical protein [Evansella sp. LMS18]UTR09505.1 hypothetical protein MM300_16625 [Evansella sp. LMS18]